MADRWGRTQTILTWSCVSLALSFSIGWMIALPLALLVALACLYNFAGIADSSTHSLVLAESVPPHYLGVAYAVRSVIGFGAGVISPVVFGWALDLAGGGKASTDAFAWGIAWMTLGLGAMLGPLATWKLRRLRMKPFSEASERNRATDPRGPEARIQGQQTRARDRLRHRTARGLLRRRVAASRVAGERRCRAPSGDPRMDRRSCADRAGCGQAMACRRRRCSVFGEYLPHHVLAAGRTHVRRNRKSRARRVGALRPFQLQRTPHFREQRTLRCDAARARPGERAARFEACRCPGPGSRTRPCRKTTRCRRTTGCSSSGRRRA